MQLLNVQIHILHTSPIFDGDVHKSRNLQIGRLNGATPTIDFFPSDLKTSEASTGAHFCKWPWGPCQGHPGVSFCNGVSFWQKCPDVGLVPEN
jgi:hypothetical protein